MFFKLVRHDLSFLLSLAHPVWSQARLKQVEERLFKATKTCWIPAAITEAVQEDQTQQLRRRRAEANFDFLQLIINLRDRFDRNITNLQKLSEIVSNSIR